MSAEADRESRPDMEAVPAPDLPDRPLPTDNNPNLQKPSPHDKLDSPEKLRARVRELRQHYQPFLQDHTPEIAHPRPRRSLDRFAFRFEEPEDRADAHRPCTDAGDWEMVDIPHYRGPVGPWAAYYKTRFTVNEELMSRGRIWLRFRAVDYICQVSVNGHHVGEHEGLFAPFGFDITDHIRVGEENVLLVRVENDSTQKGLAGNRPWNGYGTETPEEYTLDGDKVYGATGQGWDNPRGWTHCPPGAGIWQPVYLEGCPTTCIHDMFVRPQPEQGSAELWLETYRSDYSRVPTSVDLTLYPNNFQGDPIDLGNRDLRPAGPKRSLYKIDVDMPDFRWWTPDEPHLYTLRARLACQENDGETTDTQDTNFGMRSFVQDTHSPRRGTFYLNGEPVVLRGTNEMGNLSVPVQQGDPEQAIEDLLIGKAAHMNFWRITQRPVQEEVYDLCDRLGVLFQTDLPMFATMRHSCVEETARQAGEMERLIRSHPGAVISSFINEPSPSPEKSPRSHRVVDRKTMEDFFEVCINYTKLYNPDRVIKCVDGDYDPPPRHGMLDQHAYVCMHEDHGVELGKMHKGELFDIKEGWRCGVGEYGAEGLEPLDTMRKHYPDDWLPESDDDTSWTPDNIPFCQAWGWHHQWYDRQDTIKDWVEASHHHQEWAVPFMHEAWRRRIDVINSTTLHLLINAYPNNWLKSLCSVEREPLPGFFAYADANTPLAVNLRTDRHAVTGGADLNAELWFLNDTAKNYDDLRAVYWITCGDERLMINDCDGSVDATSAAFRGQISWPTPRVGDKTNIALHASLLSSSDEVVHDYTLDFTIYPPHDDCLLSGRNVEILGREDGRAWRLAEDFGANPSLWSARTDAPDLVIADHPAAVRGAAPSIAAYVRDGGSLIGLPLEPGLQWDIAGESISTVSLPPHQFVSRKTAHPIVDCLDPFHFSFWYDREHDRINHIIDSGLDHEALRPITLTGTGTWYSERREIPAGGELKLGRGTAIFDQVWAFSRMPGEPRAGVYLQNLLQYALGSNDA